MKLQTLIITLKNKWLKVTCKAITLLSHHEQPPTPQTGWRDVSGMHPTSQLVFSSNPTNIIIQFTTLIVQNVLTVFISTNYITYILTIDSPHTYYILTTDLLRTHHIIGLHT